MSDDGVRHARIALDRAGRGYLVADAMPALAAGSVYQLWAVLDGQLVSAGVLGPDTEVAAFAIEGPVTRFMVTAEKGGGVPRPTGKPILQADLV